MMQDLKEYVKQVEKAQVLQQVYGSLLDLCFKQGLEMKELFKELEEMDKALLKEEEGK